MTDLIAHGWAEELKARAVRSNTHTHTLYSQRHSLYLFFPYTNARSHPDSHTHSHVASCRDMRAPWGVCNACSAAAAAAAVLSHSVTLARLQSQRWPLTERESEEKLGQREREYGEGERRWGTEGGWEWGVCSCCSDSQWHIPSSPLSLVLLHCVFARGGFLAFPHTVQSPTDGRSAPVFMTDGRVQCTFITGDGLKDRNKPPIFVLCTGHTVLYIYVMRYICECFVACFAEATFQASSVSPSTPTTVAMRLLAIVLLGLAKWLVLAWLGPANWCNYSDRYKDRINIL